MKNTSCESLNGSFPKNDTIVLYNESEENNIQITYQCFDKREWGNLGSGLREIIYSNQYVPKDYTGDIFFIKSFVCNEEISYEATDIKDGKIKEYKFQRYSFNEKNNLLGKAYSDMSNILLENYKSANLHREMRYKSLYNKRRFGKIDLFFNNNNDLTNLIIDDNELLREGLVKNIMNHEAFLLKFQIID
ncbi:hypothetical protein CLLI_26790 [Clostridium liquoris]|uniref:Uncharacterized protein n=1 Tax=Clostridium liquoris TaxID=1289519 RepID=A0A2T0B080_9CLOT|nr:hypothetical protein [Clostridium liquoris]PRR76941.1 hypothetical protein CLLI_26790 [Clostridium liquoris]